VPFQAIHDIIGNAVPFFFGQPSRSPRTSLRAPLSAKAMAKLVPAGAHRRYENKEGTALSRQHRIRAVWRRQRPERSNRPIRTPMPGTGH
jgi:hypothetical protein